MSEYDRINDAQIAMQTAIEEADLARREALQERAAELEKEFGEARVEAARVELEAQVKADEAAKAEAEAEVDADAEDEGGPRLDNEDEIAAATSDTIADVRIDERSPDEEDFTAPGESSLPESRQVTDSDASEDDKPAPKRKSSRS